MAASLGRRLVRDERAKGTTLFVHSGDTLSPSLLSGIDKGAHIIDILNRLGVDIFAPGNHEFDFGPEVFRARMAEATFPVVTNIARQTAASRRTRSTTKSSLSSSIKVGFYGLTTEDTVIVSSPGDISFQPSLDTARPRPRRSARKGPNRRRRRPHAAPVIALRPWLSVIEAILDFARTTRLDTVVVTDPTNAARTRRHGATALVCHISSPGPETSHTTVLSMLHLLVSALAVRLGKSALRRRDLIADLREELDPQD